MPATRMAEQRATGIMLVLLATVLWSTAGLFMRMVDLDVWSILGWRSVFAAVALAGIVGWQRSKATPTAQQESRFTNLAVVPVAVVSMAAFVVSLKLTTVANVMVVYATVPLLAAGLAWLALREKLSRQALFASIVALTGVIVMVGGAVSGSHLLGIGVAFAMTAAMASQIVMARKYPNIDMAFVNMRAAAICAIFGLTMSGFGVPTLSQLIVLMLFGVSNTALAYYFVLRGARLIPSAEVGLISSIDVVLGPLWVWLVFHETPGNWTLIGGIIVLCAVLGYLWQTRNVIQVEIPSP